MKRKFTRRICITNGKPGLQVEEESVYDIKKNMQKYKSIFALKITHR